MDTVVPKKYKTAMCRNYPKCPYQENCYFAHGRQELRVIMCRNIVTYGYCRFGSSCNFLHTSPLNIPRLYPNPPAVGLLPTPVWAPVDQSVGADLNRLPEWPATPSSDHGDSDTVRCCEDDLPIPDNPPDGEPENDCFGDDWVDLKPIVGWAGKDDPDIIKIGTVDASNFVQIHYIDTSEIEDAVREPDYPHMEMIDAVLS